MAAVASSVPDSEVSQTSTSLSTATQHSDQAEALTIPLSPEVKAFLERPVSGPYRPIIFDLETTGLIMCLPCPAVPYRLIHQQMVKSITTSLHLMHSQGVLASPLILLSPDEHVYQHR